LIEALYLRVAQESPSSSGSPQQISATARDLPKGHTAQIESADIPLTREGLLGSASETPAEPEIVLPDGKTELIVHFGDDFFKFERNSKTAKDEYMRQARVLMSGQLTERTLPASLRQNWSRLGSIQGGRRGKILQSSL
jgi:hypothetical protein